MPLGAGWGLVMSDFVETRWERFKYRMTMGWFVVWGTSLCLGFLWLAIKVVKLLIALVVAI